MPTNTPAGNSMFRVAKVVYFTDLTRAGAAVIPLGAFAEVSLPHIYGLALKARTHLTADELKRINPLIRARLASPFEFLDGEFESAWKEAPRESLSLIAGRHASSISVLMPTDYADGLKWALSRLILPQRDAVRERLTAALDGEFKDVLAKFGAVAPAETESIERVTRQAA